YGEPTNGIPVKPDIGEDARALGPQGHIVSALDNAEQRVALWCLLERAFAALGPSERELHGATELGPLCGQAQAFIELHCDVGTQQNLNLDRALRRKFDDGPVEMRSKDHALVLDFAELR